MPRTPIRLSKAEERLVAVTVSAITIGEVVTSVLHNVLAAWWPAIAVFVVALLAVGSWAWYLARSRHRSVRSVVVLGLPDWLGDRERQRVPP